MSSTAEPSPYQFGKSPEPPARVAIDVTKSLFSSTIVPTTAKPALSMFGTAVASSDSESLPQFLRLEPLTLLRDNLKECSLLFDPMVLAAAIRKGCSKDEIKDYLLTFPRGNVERKISDNINGRHSAIFYAAKRAAVDIMELLLEYGANPQAKSPGLSAIPLLAATIMMTKWTYKNVDKIVALLLSYGASPHAIPEQMWSDYIKIPFDWSVEEKTHLDTTWIENGHSIILAETLNLTVRYHLNRASLITPARTRHRQIARLIGAPRILHLPFHIIGQDYSLEVVMNKILAYDAISRKRPLVLAFAGLSGHGKTELATSLGYLLGTDMCNVDMSKTHTVTSLIGAAAPYQNHDKGSPLNNYLASHTGERCVVFLDEFDKTTQEVRESLLTILDSGTGMDLRSNTATNMSKSIWILASNKGDNLITRFYNENLRGKGERERRHVSIKPLENDLRKLFIKAYTPAVTGRISSFLPFFPFSLEEAAVINHKFLRILDDQLRLPIDLHSKSPRPVGHLHLSLLRDGELCKFLAENYIQELGARSIQNGIDNLADDLFMHYTVPVDEITEATNSKPHVKYTMSLRSTANTVEVAIHEDGTTLIPSD